MINHFSYSLIVVYIDHLQIKRIYQKKEEEEIDLLIE